MYGIKVLFLGSALFPESCVFNNSWIWTNYLDVLATTNTYTLFKPTSAISALKLVQIWFWSIFWKLHFHWEIILETAAMWLIYAFHSFRAGRHKVSRWSCDSLSRADISFYAERSFSYMCSLWQPILTPQPAEGHNKTWTFNNAVVTSCCKCTSQEKKKTQNWQCLSAQAAFTFFKLETNGTILKWYTWF